MAGVSGSTYIQAVLAAKDKKLPASGKEKNVLKSSFNRYSTSVV
jgi:hypothetical protein